MPHLLWRSSGFTMIRRSRSSNSDHRDSCIVGQGGPTSHAPLVFLDPNSTHHCQPSVPATDHLPCWQTSSKSFTGTLSPGVWAFFAFVSLGHWQRLLTPMGRPYTSFYVPHLADSLVRASCLMGPKPIWDSLSWIKIQPSYSWPMCTGPTLDGPECHFRPSLHRRWPK